MTVSMTTIRRIGWSTLLFLLIFASRALLLNRLEMNHDEVWHTWQTGQSLEEAMRWLPFDWPPLYVVVLWVWQNFVGNHPIVMRLLSALIFMIGSAWTFRLGRRLFHTEPAAWGLTLAYAALGYIIFLSTYVRAYVIMLALLPLALYLALRYFDKPTIWRAVWLALAMAALFYTNLTAVIAFAAIGITTLIFYPRQIWRWWLPGTMAFVLAIPEILAKLDLVQRREAGLGEKLPSLPEGLLEIFHADLGHAALFWLLVLVIAVGFVLWKRRFTLRMGLMIVSWLLILPILVYATDGIIGFFTAQYSWWITFGFALLVAWGYQAAPRIGRIGLSLVLIGLMFVPLTRGYRPFDELKYGLPTLPFEQTFSVLATELQNGDVFLVHPDCECGDHYVWNYFESIYFPNPPQHVTEPDGHRRIWYVYRSGQNDENIQRQLEQSYVTGRFIGPWELFFRLYEAPPDRDGILFENGLRFHGAQLLEPDRQPRVQPYVYREGEDVRVRLWWSVDEPLDRDYSVTLQILNELGLFAQTDGAPQPVSLDPTQDASPSQTSQWQPGQYYIDDRVLTMPYPATRLDLMLYLGVYYWEDGVRLQAEGVNPDGLLPLLPIALMAW